MSSLTVRLQLLMKDPVAEENETFNIEMMLNNNWRIIDQLVALKSEVISGTDVDQKINAAISNLISGSPAALDTLNELAAALNDDPNFATTMTNLIATKYVKPVNGIPKADLEADVQSSLGKADTALPDAKAYTDTAPEAMLKNVNRFNTKRSNKNENQTFLTVEKRRKDGTLFEASVFSAPNTAGNPTVRTVTTYAADGTTVVGTPVVFDVLYDADGDWLEEVQR